MSRRFAGVGARIGFTLIVFAVVAGAIMARPAKWMLDFDQSFYLTVAYDLDRHHVFSNGVFDAVDSTVAAPPPGMFFAPLYPWLIVAAMKIDPRFAAAVRCAVEADHKKRDFATCEIYARPMLLIHALFLTIAVLSIALAGEIVFPGRGLFYAAGVVATVGAVAWADLFSFIMTESVWLSLYSVLMLCFVAALKTARTRYYLLAGILLGALCLARPSFLALVPVLLCMIPAYAWLSRERRSASARNVSALAIAFLVVIAPWVTRNLVSVGKLRFTEEYGSATLVERFAFNDMRLGEIVLAFPYCVPTIGPSVVGRLFGPQAMSRFEWNQPGSFFDVGRARRMQLTAAHGQLDPIIGNVVRDEMQQNWWRHIATTIPLAWCGLWVAGLSSLVMVPLFAWACVAAARRRKILFFAYALPALLLVGLHAAIANHYSRYNLGLIGPYSVGAAWLISRALVVRARKAA